MIRTKGVLVFVIDDLGYLSAGQENTQQPPTEQATNEQQINLTTPFMDTQIAGKLKYVSSPIFQQFLNYLPDAPITRYVKQIKDAQEKANRNKKTTQTPDEKKSKSTKADAPSTEFLKKTFGPKRGP